MMTNPKKKGGQSKSNVKVNTEVSTLRNRRIAIFERRSSRLSKTTTRSIIDTVSDVIVKKLLSNCSFVDKLADKYCRMVCLTMSNKVFTKRTKWITSRPTPRSPPSRIVSAICAPTTWGQDQDYKEKRKLDSKQIRAKQYEVTSFLSTDCELSTEACSKNVYVLAPGVSRRSR